MPRVSRIVREEIGKDQQNSSEQFVPIERKEVGGQSSNSKTKLGDKLSI